MDIVQAIFDAFGGPTAIANATGFPVQTVHSWKPGGRIPKWRRPALLAAADRSAVTLPRAAREYLTDATSATEAA